MSDALGGGSLTLLGVMYHEKGAYRGRKGSNKDSGAVGSAEGTGVTLQLPAGFDEMRPEMQAHKDEKKLNSQVTKPLKKLTYHQLIVYFSWFWH